MAKRYVLGPNAARKVAALLRGSGEVSRRQSATSALAFDSEYVAPFTVQWAQSANDGEGSWIIWLPSDSLLICKGVPVDVRTGLDEVGGDYPDGWYLLDAIPGDEDAIVYMSVDIEAVQPYAEFSDSAGGLGETSVDVVICETFVDSQSGERQVKQLVSSVVTLGDVAAPLQNTYGCDERSISLIQSMSGETPSYGRHFYIAGFGKFSVPGAAAPYGTYAPPSVLTLTDSPSEVAVLVRVGNSDQADANLLGFRKLKVSGGGAAKPACFDLVSSTSESGGVTTTTVSLVRCYYNVGGITRHNADIDVTSIISNAASGSILAFAKTGYAGAWGAQLFADAAALSAFQNLAANYAVPLYEMAGNGAEVSADLRNAPQIQMVEALS